MRQCLHSTYLSSFKFYAILLLAILLSHPCTATTIDLQKQRPGAVGIIIFVHGIYGDPNTTFANPSAAASWPQMLAADNGMDGLAASPPMSHYDIGLVKYDGDRNSGLSIKQIADQLTLVLKDRGIFHTYDHIIFITHSMGGLVLKTMLVNMTFNNDPNLAKIMATLFISVPAQGSPAATLISELPAIFGAGRPIGDLTPLGDNTFLQMLETQWRTVVNTRKNGLPKIFCAYETKPISVGLLRTLIIVPEAYTTTQCDNDPWPESLDHISIVKPLTPKDSIYVWARGRIDEAFDATSRVATTPSGSPNPAATYSITAEGVTPDIQGRKVDLPRDANYGKRCSDERGEIGIMCLKDANYATFQWRFPPDKGYHWDPAKMTFEVLTGSPFGGIGPPTIDKGDIVVGAFVRSDPPNKAKGRLSAFEFRDAPEPYRKDIISGKIEWGKDIYVTLPPGWTSWSITIDIPEKNIRRTILPTNMESFMPSVGVSQDGGQLVVHPSSFKN